MIIGCKFRLFCVNAKKTYDKSKIPDLQSKTMVACVHEFIKFLSELAVFAQSQLWLAICIQNVLIFTKIISFIHATCIFGLVQVSFCLRSSSYLTDYSYYNVSCINFHWSNKSILANYKNHLCKFDNKIYYW